MRPFGTLQFCRCVFPAVILMDFCIAQSTSTDLATCHCVESALISVLLGLAEKDGEPSSVDKRSLSSPTISKFYFIFYLQDLNAALLLSEGHLGS